jgi:hypothetical protein
MSLSILGCSWCGGGNGAWILGWNTAGNPIGEKGLIPDERVVEPGDESVDGSEGVASILEGGALVVNLDMPETRLTRRRIAGACERSESSLSIARRFRFGGAEDSPSSSSAVVVATLIFSPAVLWSSVIMIGVVRHCATTCP